MRIRILFPLVVVLFITGLGTSTVSAQWVPCGSDPELGPLVCTSGGSSRPYKTYNPKAAPRYEPSHVPSNCAAPKLDVTGEALWIGPDWEPTPSLRRYCAPIEAQRAKEFLQQHPHLQEEQAALRHKWEARREKEQRQRQAGPIFEHANQLYLQKRWKEAEAEYRRALAVDPSDAWGHVNLARVLQFEETDEGRLQALAEYKTALELDSTMAEARTELESLRKRMAFRIAFKAGVDLFNRGDFKGAEEKFREATELDPKSENAAHNLKAVRAKLPNFAPIESQGQYFIIAPDGRKRSGDREDFVQLDNNSRIVTGPNGSVKINLPDETSFSLGPNSNMVLDEFVYDPATITEKIVARFVRGVFRLVSGKPKTVDLKMKVGTAGQLGHRGTDYEVFVAADGSGYVKVSDGIVDVTENDGTILTLQAGQTANFSADGRWSRPNTRLPWRGIPTNF